MKVGVTNAVLSNSGDAAIFLGIRATLAQSEGHSAEVVVFDSNERHTSELYPELSVFQQLVQAHGNTRFRFLAAQISRTLLFWFLSYTPGALRALASTPGFRRTSIGRSLVELCGCDVVVSSGGTYLVDHYDFTHRMVELRCAKALGIPVVLWTQSLGPFGTRRSRWLARQIAAIVDAVYCRDSRSLDEWRTVTGYGGPLGVAPDAAFVLTGSTTKNSADMDTPPRAAISVREWSRGVDAAALDQEQYTSMMRASIDALDRLGWSSLAISTCQGLPSYAFDDVAVAKWIFQGLDVKIDTDFHRPEGLLDVLAGCQLVVTTRMHLAILALVSRVPVIAVAYEFKTIELFSSVGLPHAVIRIEDSSPAWMLDTIRWASEEPDRFRLSGDRLDRLRDEAAAPAEIVRELARVSTAPAGGSV